MSRPRDDIPETDTLAAAARLEQSMAGLREDIGTLRSYSQRTRHFAWGLAVSIALDVVLTVALVLVATQANEASTAAERNAQTQEATCRASNEIRKANLALWDYVISLIGQGEANPSPRQQQTKDDLKEFVHGIYQPRNCDNLDAPPPPIPPVPTR